MKTPLPSPVRDLIALVVVALACPVAVFGGANIGCVGHTTFAGSCALTVIFVSPLVLFIGGAIAGVTTRGWTGLLVVMAGTMLGMMGILFLSELAGRPVPLDWFSAVVATVFFGGPIIIGYGIGRLVMHLRAARSR